MVTGAAARDAVARARRLPGLRVGLHLTLVDGLPLLPPATIPALVGRDGRFRHDQARAGLAFFFRPAARRQLAAEIRAQFAAFAATGLDLDHVDAHKHMHLHPTVARLIVEIGRDYGLRAMRLPAEPGSILAPWTALLRRRLRRAGIACNDRVYGIRWSGAMTEARLLSVVAALPEGVSEIYLHPATSRSPALVRAMPGYRNDEEFAALVSPVLRRAVAEAGIVLTHFGQIAG